MKGLAYFVLFVFLIGCSTSSLENRAQQEVKEERFSTKVARYIPALIKNKSSEVEKAARFFYKKIDHQVVWHDSTKLNKRGGLLLEILSNWEAYGIDTASFNVKELLTYSDSSSVEERLNLIAFNDVLLTKKYFRTAQLLAEGLMDSIPYGGKNSIRVRNKKDYSKEAVKAFKNTDLISYLEEVQPQHEEYKILLKKSLEFHQLNKLNNICLVVRSEKLDSSIAIESAKSNLLLFAYGDSSMFTNDSTFKSKLMEFQYAHGLVPDGVIGENTAKALSKNIIDYKRMLTINLERWRWENKWTGNYIYVNIPSFKLRFMANKEVRLENKVVVGKRNSKTPIMTDTLEYMVAYPDWNVPYSISSRELLRKLQKDSSYLDQHNYVLMNHLMKELDAKKIDWSLVNRSSFPYRIKQRGGQTNALGLIKFIFPNSNNVYIHDTNLKRFFNTEIRAFSHGCIRLQNPMDLAEQLLLFQDSLPSLDSLNNLIVSRKKTKLLMNDPVPVHVAYFTAGVDQSGQLIFYPDVYGYDEKLLQQMFN